MDIGSWLQNFFNLNSQSIFQMCVSSQYSYTKPGLNKCKVGPQKNCMDAEDGLSRISFHTGSKSVGVFWLALVSSPPGKYCQWFGVGLRTCCCLLIPTDSALLHARVELWPQHRCAWSEIHEADISLFSLLNSFSRAASFYNPWQGILTLCLDSKTQSVSCRYSQTFSLVPDILIQHPRNWEKQFYYCFRGEGK